jgi:hypothetical protein
MGVVDKALVASNTGAVEDDALALVSIAQSTVEVTLEGFVGDKHAGMTARATTRTPHYPLNAVIRNSRQLSIVSPDDLAMVANRLAIARILPEWFGANLSIDRIPRLTSLPPATRLYFPNDAVLVVEGENLPCAFPGKVLEQQYPAIRGLASRFPKAAFHHRGVVAWVERAGMISQSDEVVIQVPTQAIYSLPSDSAAPVAVCVPRGAVPLA